MKRAIYLNIRSPITGLGATVSFILPRQKAHQLLEVANRQVKPKWISVTGDYCNDFHDYKWCTMVWPGEYIRSGWDGGRVPKRTELVEVGSAA